MDTQAPTQTSDQPDFFRIMLDAIWNAINTVTGMFGLTPLQVVMIVSVLLGALMMWHLIRAMLQKQTWTLDPKDTPVAFVILPESANLHSAEDDE